jgi:hypothetical protein
VTFNGEVLGVDAPDSFAEKLAEIATFPRIDGFQEQLAV